MNLALLSIVISILYQPCSSLLSNYCSGYVYSKTFRLNAVKEIHTPSELDAVTVRSNAIVVIDYQKSKCKPCMKIEPLFIALSEKYSSQVEFYKVDADTSSTALAMMKHNGVRSVPTFHIWNSGNRIDTIQGAHVDDVEAAIQDEIKKVSS